MNEQRRLSYPDEVALLICGIYINNYLSGMGRDPLNRSLHYNRTVENVKKGCISDVQASTSPHVSRINRVIVLIGCHLSYLTQP